jgi:phospholipase D1/2
MRERKEMFCYRFINGKTYMEAVAKALLTAKDEVFITDWWLSPEIMMIRPSDDETYRLDLLLGKIAVRFQLSLFFYKEFSFFRNLRMQEFVYM